jgi:hypothetical protein
MLHIFVIPLNLIAYDTSRMCVEMKLFGYLNRNLKMPIICFHLLNDIMKNMEVSSNS